ncbi:colanic acid biosynthesis acetyltransferase WcaF [Sulfurimonas sp. SAG-AH-194-C21]|nr:WcaF family extracellular polysaccharide biosynthesis acetyltransferase [Sulfurimonas sp. SAG-AH-194-C21]MDF1884414.1 colanic acid biosynthesis acetyltransferase WcaF [Sulfurimonas sp. SAG-AH-194-C21]
MKKNQVNLNSYNNSEYKPGSTLKKTLWYFTNMFFFQTNFPVPSKFKVFLLQQFGASVGKRVTLKPSINIKYPWFLDIGDDVWVGENVWIDNLAQVSIGHNVVLSQDSYLLTGSHDYKEVSFNLILGKITLEDGVWIGAKAIVCPGVTCKTHSILSVGSVATQNLEKYTIYQGNPAMSKRTRVIV